MFFIRILFIVVFSISAAIAAGSGSSGGSGSSAGDGNSYGEEFNKDLALIIKDIKKEEFESAIKKLEVFVYENPQNADGWNYIGFVSRKLMKYDDAERYYAYGLEINPKHIGILEYLGELYLETDRLDEAKANLSILDDLCNFNCIERNKLRDLINEKLN